MAAPKLDLTIEQNANFAIRVTVNDATVDPNVPINLTGCTITSQIRQYPYGSVIATFQTAIIDAVNGKFTLQLNAFQTSALPQIALKYDVVLTKSDGVTKQRLMQGDIKVGDPITI